MNKKESDKVYALFSKGKFPKPKIANAKFSRVKCDCGHYPKDHYGRQGWCDKCGCTWYYPNYRYILRKKAERAAERKAKREKRRE